MRGNYVKYPRFSEYDFIRLYCALNVKRKNSPIIIPVEFEKKLYEAYLIENFENLFEDIEISPYLAEDNNGYVCFKTAFQTAQTLGLLIRIQDCGLERFLIACDEAQAETIISDYDEKFVSSMSVLLDLSIEKRKVLNKKTRC